MRGGEIEEAATGPEGTRQEAEKQEEERTADRETERQNDEPLLL